MSKLMSVLGIVLLAVGVALALVGFVNPAQMQVYGLTIETASVLLTGGILAIGLGGVIAALEGRQPVVSNETAVDTFVPATKTEAPVIEATKAVEAAAAEETPVRVRFPGFGRKVAATGTAVAATATVAEAAPAASPVDETIAALEQAKADIANAVGGVTTLSEPAVEDAVEDVEEDTAEDEESADGELYVVEEREIRGRPARILSDDTVEAETDEGWMRFENLEHLNEYLDSAAENA
jgi:hypothetical protein